MSYLIDKFKGVYRLKAPIDETKNDFPRKLNGNYEDIDVYIDCQHGNKVTHYGRTVLQAYIPSIGRGHNLLKMIHGKYGDIIFNIQETDSEVLFKFHYKDSDKIIPLLKPRTNGAGISPFSSKNLHKNKDYKISYEEIQAYKEIVAKIPPERILVITHNTNNFLKSLVTKKNTWENIKADMKLKGLKGKEYIHSIDKWDEYIKYLNDELDKGEM